MRVTIGVHALLGFRVECFRSSLNHLSFARWFLSADIACAEKKPRDKGIVRASVKVT